jgi:hypothetical protein
VSSQQQLKNSDPASVLVRAAVVFPVFWVLCVATCVYLLEPYGYMGDSDYSHMFKVMLFPVAIVWVGLFLYKRLVAPRGIERPRNET